MGRYLAQALPLRIFTIACCSLSVACTASKRTSPDLSDLPTTNDDEITISADSQRVSRPPLDVVKADHTETDTEPSETREKRSYKCTVEPESDELVDRVRANTHTRLCRTAGWLDGLFGDEYAYPGQDFRGKIAVGIRHDEIESIDPRLRVRIKTKLPNMSRRFDAFLGRVEEDSYIANTEVNQDRLNNVGLRSTNDDDSEWLIGLGYRRPKEDDIGWDYSVGAKISGGFRPYARAEHNYLATIDDDRYWKTQQTVFWRKRDGFGISSNMDYTHLFGDKDIWILHGSAKYTEEEKQIEWFADTRWHHSITKKKGISSTAYVRGEAENEVAIPEFGMTFTYIQPIFRDWLILETGLDWRWERQTKAQPEYKSAIRVGIQIEMLLGDYYRMGRRSFLNKETR